MFIEYSLFQLFFLFRQTEVSETSAPITSASSILDIKTKNPSVEKERSIDSKAQKKTNEITKFRINAFL